MRLFAIAGLLIATGCWAQDQTTSSREKAERDQTQTPPAAQKEDFTIPAGTKVPLTLTNPIRTRSVRPGDSIRAVTAFPVTIGTQVMIPPGTYVEGALEKVIKRDSTGHPGLQIHFSRMVFTNGYAVGLDGAMAQAKVSGLVTGSTEVSTAKSQTETREGLGGGLGGGLGFQQPPGPTPPPLPPLPGPHMGTVMGISAGVTAAAIVSAIVLHRHRGDDVLFDSGWQFEMVLESPLSLDAYRVAAALADSSTK